ncbi:MAG: hypothetical protein EBT07_13615 [Actinobacteria bacterium]|nr:hypothetical protein [Actinomycetota bacterium]
MKGRKKNRAEKYDPTEDVMRQYVKAVAGKFADHAGWICAREWCKHLKAGAETKKRNEELWKKDPVMDPRLAMENWCKELLQTKHPIEAANGFAEFAQAIRAAAALVSNGKNEMDPQRTILLEANLKLHKKLAAEKKYFAKVKKGDLVKLAQSKEVFDDMDQPGILRMLREMGLPKWPDYLRPYYKQDGYPIALRPRVPKN